MKKAASIFRFLLEAAARGERTALVTITDVIGRSSRDAGTHMAVSETGAFKGSLSGGCVEAAVVGEALRVIRQGEAELLRFGLGSPFLDIRLPCGGGIDLLIVPEPAYAVIEAAEQRLAARRPAAFALTRGGTVALAGAAPARSGWDGDLFIASHRPDLRLFIVGHGAETEALARLSTAYGAEVRVLTPDATIVETLEGQGIAVWRLKTPARSAHLATDPHSAVVMLFHDHDWETELLAQALEQDSFFIGAMGSRATHARRLEALAGSQVNAAALARVEGPIGLIPATRDPDTLALSVLAQVVARYDESSAGEPAAMGEVSLSRVAASS